jgi:hypothetical protein
MTWVLRNNDSGQFVAPPGGEQSYTPMLRRAQRYDSRKRAEADACSNETPVKYEEAG